MIYTTNKIFRISCGVGCALKLIGRKKCACVPCACLSMGGSHALFWSSHPVLAFPPPFGDLQAAVIPFSSSPLAHIENKWLPATLTLLPPAVWTHTVRLQKAMMSLKKYEPCTFQSQNAAQMFLCKCVSEGNRLSSETCRWHFHFI